MQKGVAARPRLPVRVRCGGQVPPREELTFEKKVFADRPTARSMTAATTAMRTMMSAYSTIPCPSSSRRDLRRGGVGRVSLMRHHLLRSGPVHLLLTPIDAKNSTLRGDVSASVVLHRDESVMNHGIPRDGGRRHSAPGRLAGVGAVPPPTLSPGRRCDRPRPPRPPGRHRSPAGPGP